MSVRRKPAIRSNFLLGQHPAKLALCHLRDCLLQSLGPAIVEIGSRDGHVAQTWDAEDKPILRLPGHGEPAEIRRAHGLLLKWVSKDAKALKQIAANAHALVAGDAAIVLEQLVAVLLPLA